MPDPAPATGPAGTRRRLAPGQPRLLVASGLALFGAFLPWVLTALGSVSGARGAGLWVAYAAMLGLAGGLVPARRLAAAQGAVLAVTALVLPLWQVVHLLRLVGTAGWTPGPGLVVCVGAAVLAGQASWRLFRPPVPS